MATLSEPKVDGSVGAETEPSVAEHAPPTVPLPSTQEDASATMLWTSGRAGQALVQIGRRLGVGGFAEVCEAELVPPGQELRRVALKRLLPGLRGDPFRKRQLRREAQIAAQLNHPNIARFDSLVEMGDEVALAFEILEGLTGNQLVHRLRERRLRLRLPALIAIQRGLFSALQYLESPLGLGRPLVHADISLENVIVTTRGEVKLIDFGVAGEAVGEAPGERAPDDALTGLHFVAGKRPYLPPEGEGARVPSSQSDLYAAGVCFWELCTGWRFPVLPEEVTNREMGSLVAFAADGLPRPVWTLLKSCLSADPRTRVQAADGALVILAELESMLSEEELLGRYALGPMVAGLRSSLDWNPTAEAPALVETVDGVPDLLRRIERAFCPHRAAVYVPSVDDTDGCGLALRAAVGAEAAGSEDAGLLQALDSGFVAEPDGALYFRTRLPGEGEGVLVVDAGPGCAYPPKAQALLRNLFAPGTK